MLHAYERSGPILPAKDEVGVPLTKDPFKPCRRLGHLEAVSCGACVLKLVPLSSCCTEIFLRGTRKYGIELGEGI
jgi:hypothetical protein